MDLFYMVVFLPYALSTIFPLGSPRDFLVVVGTVLVMDTSQLLVIGKISKAHGIKGKLKVAVYSGDCESLLAAETVYIGTARQGFASYTLSEVSPFKQGVLIGLESFENINDVLHFINQEVALPKEELAPLEEGEYYWYQLTGLSVYTESGLLVGQVDSVFNTGSNDILAVKNGRKQVANIPFLEDVIIRVDIAEQKIVIRPVEGLFDDLFII
jgi:16S rRNA processing protein RimM